MISLFNVWWAYAQDSGTVHTTAEANSAGRGWFSYKRAPAQEDANIPPILEFSSKQQIDIDGDKVIGQLDWPPRYHEIDGLRICDQKYRYPAPQLEL